MIDVTRIQRLVEEILESGRSPEEVCDGDPDLLAEVRQRLARARALDVELSAMFPARVGAAGPWPNDLPRIPGYHAESELGRGGMGVVYRARHLRLNRLVAIKMLLAGAYASANDLRRFRREVEAVAGLRHPHIVQVYDVGELDGSPYFTMELVAGGTLAERLNGDPQPTDEAARLLLTLADATQAAHDSGVVHRDLKPSNILLDVDGTAKISDFGLARRITDDSAQTLSGARLGTPRYMAPEQAMGQQHLIGPAVDVYALGVLLYEVMTGRPPFCGESLAETERQVIDDDPLPPSRLNPKVPRDLETICLKCLSKEPARRYATARALADDLRRFQDGRPITARPVGPMERAARWVRRKPTATALVVTAILLVGVVGYTAAGALARAATRRAETAKWSERIEFVQTLQQEGRFAEARAILGRLPDGGSSDLRRRIERAERELEFVAQLDSIRLTRGFSEEADRFDRRADVAYEAAFAGAGFAVFVDPPQAIARRVRESDVWGALVAALDDWTLCVRDKGRLQRLLAISRRADPDPWRDRVRDPSLWGDPDAIRALVESASAGTQPVPLLLVLAGLFTESGGDAGSLLRSVQVAHPDDFWVNMLLAEELGPCEQSVGFLRAAVAVRPDALPARVNLAMALEVMGCADEAMAQWRQARRSHPDSALARQNLAIAYLNRDALEDAVEEARASIQLDPAPGLPHAVCGTALARLARFAEAAVEFRAALERWPPEDPRRDACQESLQSAEESLALQPRLPAVLDGRETPSSPVERLGFARLLYALGQWGESADFFAIAFAEHADLAADLASSDRYLAACAAALAGCAPIAAGALDPGEPARMRRQAIAWLREDLAAWQAIADGGDPAIRASLPGAVERWQGDPDLAGLRDPDRLLRLDPAERDACLALWRDVDQLIESTRP